MALNVRDNKMKVIVGLGQTGLSCARYLRRRNESFTVVDTRRDPPGLDALKKECPEARVELGALRAETIMAATELIVSPGVDLRNPVLRRAIAAGIPVTGDIGIFARQVEAPLVAVTGSNGKSTVVALLGEMARKAGVDVVVAGNIGTPVLDLLDDDKTALYVLELSSFQLETTENLGAEVATVLNMSSDHMDRYDSMAAYHAAKHRIFQGCRQIVVNRDDPLSKPLLPDSVREWTFGLSPADIREFGLLKQDDKTYLAFDRKPLLAVDELRIAGRHNVSNALAALALGHAAGLGFDPMIEALKEFPGLPHRCQWVAEKGGVNYYNDSKGTNVGACKAAVEGLAGKGKIVLILGGQGKGADFSTLAEPVARHCRMVVVFGEDAVLIRDMLQDAVRIVSADSLEQAVTESARHARHGDIVLLSPACASFDMFANYERRGEAFVRAVEGMH